MSLVDMFSNSMLNTESYATVFQGHLNYKTYVTKAVFSCIVELCFVRQMQKHKQVNKMNLDLFAVLYNLITYRECVEENSKSGPKNFRSQ